MYLTIKKLIFLKRCVSCFLEDGKKMYGLKVMTSILSTVPNDTDILVKNICYHKQDLLGRCALFSIQPIKLFTRVVYI